MSLDSPFTLSVNTDNDDGTTAAVDKTFTHYSTNGDKSTYISDSHEVDARDVLNFFRTPPKSNGYTRGVARSSFKLTKDVSVPGVDQSINIVQPSIVEVKFNFPLGMTDAQRTEHRMVAATLILNNVIMKNLHDLQII